MSTAPDIAVVLVGYNSQAHLEGCLQSMSAVDWGGYSYEVIYIDNASKDGSVALLRQRFPWVRVIENQENLGFCRGCNQGVESTQGRFIYLLNNDTRLLPTSVRPLATFLDTHPEAAAVGNRLLNPDGTDQWSGRRFPTWHNALFGRRTPLAHLFAQSEAVRDYLYKDSMAQGEPFEVEWIPGSCTLVRRECFLQVGRLPEEMHYWSDAVFCDRLRRAGKKVYIVPGSPLIHFEGEGSGNKSPAVRKWLISDFHQGAFRFYCEHHNLGPWSFSRWLAKLALGLRARLLMLND